MVEPVVAWRSEDGGTVVGCPGDSRGWRIEHGRPLMAPKVLARTTSAVCHLAVADMDWDGALDLVMVPQAEHRLDWFPLTGNVPEAAYRGAHLRS